ncbi:hypothetical protein F7D42_10130 [Prevotella copri]|uniref:Uncharacterized protein n=1 Tax=Segatella copri TaxID=165179 RepID=A0A6A7VN15_9BACT|nr:hypothetical protein [Segatella copri]MQN64237.1 hypothetical protein [Segatella copri]MQO56053.1 hypothetical protein [Segatella copri]MQO96582.1 hypothetical protein [Segatella copri]
MNKELLKIQFMLDGVTSVINDPSKSLKDTICVYKDSSNIWRYAGGGALSALAVSAGITAGSSVVVGSSALSGLGMAALTAAGAAGSGAVAAGAGLSATGIGVIVGGILIVGGGIALYKAKQKAKQKAKKEKEEKVRMYREIIKKQQAAINKEKDFNRKLEEALRREQGKSDNKNKDIENLKYQIKNLQEVIELLTEQLNAFGKDD